MPDTLPWQLVWGDPRLELAIGGIYSCINKLFSFSVYLSMMMGIHVLDLDLLGFVVGNGLTVNVLADVNNLGLMSVKG